jgi:hypothetical protein
MADAMGRPAPLRESSFVFGMRGLGGRCAIVWVLPGVGDVRVSCPQPVADYEI